MNPKLQSLNGLKFHPIRPDIPIEALFTTPAVDSFLRRVQLGIADDGYRVVMNSNRNGGQTVFHIHMHLLAGAPLTGGLA